MLSRLLPTRDPLPDHTGITTSPATPVQRHAAVALALGLIAILAGSIPFTLRPVSIVTGIAPVIFSLIAFATLITAYLLIVQFRVHRAPALMLLAAAYSFSGLMTVVHLLTFPGIFTPTGLFGAQEATTSWVWVFAHAGFPLLVILALIVERRAPNAVTRLTAIVLLAMTLGAAMLLVSLFALVAIHVPPWLPTIIVMNDSHPFFTSGVGVAVWLLNTAALVALFRLGRGRGRGVIRMWVTVAVFAALCEVSLRLIGGSQYDVGWYSAGITSVLAACVVLAALLATTHSLYYRVTTQELELRTLFDLSPIGMARITLDDHFLETNEALRAMLGYQEAALRTMTLYSLIAADHQQGEIRDWRGGASRGYAAHAVEAPLTRRDGSVFWAEVRIALVRGRAGIAPHCIVLMEDISARREYEQAMSHEASHDLLTGLPNRRHVLDHLAQAMRRSALMERKVAVLFLDLDGFKAINDTFGHEAGDMALCEVARRLEACIRIGNMAARIGGDEFVLVLPGIHRREDSEAVIARIHAALNYPIIWGDATLSVRTSIGVSCFPDDGDTAAALLNHADRAMYQRKAARKATTGR